MDVLLDVIFEMLSIIIVGIICIIIYIYGKLLLIKIGIIESDQIDDSRNLEEKE